MRRQSMAIVLGALVLTSAAAQGTAFAGNEKRPGGTITTPAAPIPDNGGDQGWGNCGHNSSAGNPHTGTQGSGGGNGGYRRGDVCAPAVPDDPSDPGDGSDIGVS